MADPELNELLRGEIERRLPLFEAETDRQTLRAALHGLRGSISMAGYTEVSLVLGQLGRRLLEGDDGARLEAHELLAETVSRLAEGLPALGTSWPTPPDRLQPSRLEPSLERDYRDAMRDRLGEIDAALVSEGSAKSALGRAFRSVHSMKSTASGVGDDAFAWYCHGLESYLKPALDSEEAARDAMVKLARHRALCAVWLQDAARAIDTLRALARRPSTRPPKRAGTGARDRANRKLERGDGRLSGTGETSSYGAFRDSTSAEVFERVTRSLSYVLASTDRLASIETRGSRLFIAPDHAEALEQALVQLVRNAVAHGIEPPDERRRANKLPTGRITLSAERDAGRLRFVVEDDGRGIDAEHVRLLVDQRGLLGEAARATLAEEDLLPFLFVPGLSTQREADLLGGRGMGLDIAREAVRRLGGSIGLSSRPGHGLRATIELPVPRESERRPRFVGASASHLAAIREISRAAGLEVDPEGELARSDAYLLVAEGEHGDVVGFASARSIADVVELLDVATLPAWRRRGIAEGLLRELVRLARQAGQVEIHLEVRESNLGAIALYDKLGFYRMRRRERYYQNPVEDALCMRLVL